MKHACMREHWFSTVLVCLLTVTVGIHGSLVPKAYSAEWSAPEEVLTFLTDVVRLDIIRYNVTLVSNVESYPSDLGGLPQESGKYTLESNESKLAVTYNFKNKTLAWLKLYVYEGSPLTVEQPPTNLIERTDVLLQRYQNYLGTSDCQEMRNILATVTEVKDTAITVGNVRFDLTKYSLGTRFRWVYTFNGADYTSLSISFRQGFDFSFSDDRLIYKIGSTDVNVSKEEAISIARERAKNLTWWANMGNYSIEVNNFTIVDDFTEAGLLTAPREPLVLYPYWAVTLYFDKFYPTNVYGVTYEIWADTGEIFNGFLRSFGGSPPSEENATTPPVEPPNEPPTELPTEENPTVPPTEPPPEDPTLPPTEPLTVPPPEDSTDQTNPDPTLILIVVPILLAIIFGVIYHRGKKNESLEPPT